MKRHAQEIPDYHEPAGKSEANKATIQAAAAISILQSSTTVAEPREDAATITTVQTNASDAMVEASGPKPESLSVSSDQPAPRKRPSAVRLLGEVRMGLGIGASARPVPTVSLSAAQEQDLKAEILRTWKQYEQSEKALAPLLYKLCTALHAPGQAGKGFEAWLKKHHKPKVTAYRWIKKYAEREGLPLPYKQSKNGSNGRSSSATGGATSSFHMERRLGPPAQSDQGQSIQPDVTFIPIPKSLYEFEELYDRYLEGLSEADRHARTFEFISWLKAKLSSVANDEPPQEAAGD